MGVTCSRTQQPVDFSQTDLNPWRVITEENGSLYIYNTITREGEYVYTEAQVSEYMKQQREIQTCVPYAIGTLVNDN